MVMEDLGRAVTDLHQVRMVVRARMAGMGILLADLVVRTARAAKGQMEALGTMEDRKADLVQETMAARMVTLDQEAMEA